MGDCIFCRIAEKKIPARIVYEDDLILAFEDVHPQAPVHTLIIPKKHIPTLIDAGDVDSHLFGHIMNVANIIATEKGIATRGFRLVANCNPDAGQSVYHIHFHLLGGRQMQWPPG
jgi:histidine triad (HIT) family protein